MEPPARIAPTTSATIAAATAAAASARFSREDLRHALHAHFHSARAPGAPSATTTPGTARRRVFAFLLVQKKKLSLTSKRLFASGNNSSHSSSSNHSAGGKSYVLCVTTTPNDAGPAHLHYVQLSSTLAVDPREAWDLGALEAIETHGPTAERRRGGAFSLLFRDDDAPWQWLVDERGEPAPTAMDEFLWALCALLADRHRRLPRLVRINVEALAELAIHRGLGARYGLDVDLLDALAAMKKRALRGPDEAPDGGHSGDTGTGQRRPRHPEDDTDPDATSGKGDDDTKGRQTTSAQRLTAAEDEDATALLAGVNWSDAQLGAIEEDLKRQLRVLEDDNITFLLSFEGHARTASHHPPQPQQQQQQAPSKATTRTTTTTTSVDKILVAIEALQRRMELVQDWTRESGEFLDRTSLNMTHFETLNNQLEVHFKNSVALQETLEALITAVEIPRELMGLLLKPVVGVFPEAGADGAAEAAAGGGNGSRDLAGRMAATLAMLERVDGAIRATRTFPASEMAAFRSRGEELTRLARGYCDKLTTAFDGFLQRKIKHWLAVSRMATTTGNAHNNTPTPTKSRMSAFARDHREVSSSVRSQALGGGALDASSASRLSRTFTNVEGEIRDMDWAFTNELFHAALIEYQPLFAQLQRLDPRVLLGLRQVYVKHLASVYNPHALALARCLKDRLPKPPKHHFHKPQSLQSWSVHLSSSQLGDALGAAPLMQQALEHLVPLVTREQHFLAMLFFPDDDEPTMQSDELTSMLEGVFEKLLKRLNDFGEAAAARNILDALSLVVLVHAQLEGYRTQSEFLYNLLVSFQLQMKRVLIKFTEEQEAWIQHHHTDTRMAGVLSPIQKTLVMIGRLEECVGARTDDPTLTSIYHRILPTTLQWLEKVADAKPKYASMTRLENYLFIHERLMAINPSMELPLGQYAAQARDKYEDNLRRYVVYIWEYEFKQLVPMFHSLEELIKTIPVTEIPFHTSRQDVRQVLEHLSTGFEKSVKSMHDRMKKHFTVNPKMLPLVWGHLVSHTNERLTAYEKIAADCYQLRLEPSPHRAVDMLNKFASSSATSASSS